MLNFSKSALMKKQTTSTTNYNLLLGCTFSANFHFQVNYSFKHLKSLFSKVSLILSSVTEILNSSETFIFIHILQSLHKTKSP